MLYESLLANSHPLEPEDLSNAIVDCLPQEMHSCIPPLYGALYDQTPTQMLRLLRLHAYGVKFNDQIPRPLRKAAPAIVKPSAEEAQGQKPRKMRCSDCGSTGQVRKDYTKCEKLDKETADIENYKSPLCAPVVMNNIHEVPCPSNVLPLPVTLHVVSFNVLQLGGGGKECDE